MSRRRSLCAAVLAAAVSISILQPSGADPVLPDDAIVALNILPPGEGRHLNTAELALWALTGAQDAHNTDQLDLYDRLGAGAAGINESTDLTGYFKDASFGVAPGDAGRTYSPRPGTTVIRDLSYGVPHVFGTTRSDTMYGAGYVSAEDRLFMMDVLRHLARGRLSELLGASDSNLAADRAQRLVADYTEEELNAMGQRLLTLDPELGSLALNDITDFSAGVNAYIAEALLDPMKLPGEYPALQQVPLPWKPTDSIALATLIGGQFSVGGGGQIENDRFLDALEQTHTAGDARAIFDDFRFANDPEAPTAAADAFPFNATLAPVDPDAVARPDDASALDASMRAALLPPEIDGPFGPIRLAAPGGASNALLIDAAHSTTGRPIAVMGPQVGYYSPEILMEIDLHGPGVHARGAGFPGISFYVLLGRGKNYGWSATTAIGDHIDIRAVRLCDPTGGELPPLTDWYLRDGRCVRMYSRTDSWLAKPSAGGVPSSPSPDRVLVSMSTQRTLHGIVIARGTVEGAPVAFVRERSSYRKEVDATLTYVEIHDPSRINGMSDLMHAFDRFSFSFNWHLITNADMGFYTTGLYPVMADGVDPDLPFWGDSRWDAKRTLTFAEHPQTVNPAQGYVTNWNNKQAPLFRASDNWYSYGPVGRVQLLTDHVLSAMAGDGKVSMAELVKAMGVAATQDLRGVKVLPYLLDVLGTSTGDARADQGIALLDAWEAAGSHRLDSDGDGIYEHRAAVSVMDAAWDYLLEEIFSPELGPAFATVPLIHDDKPGPGGSAYFEGWYGHAQKDLRQILGLTVAQPFSRTYCGAGVVAACRAALVRAVGNAVSDLISIYGTDTTTWGGASGDVRAVEDRDAIVFSPVGVIEQTPMQWQNRPTFQQVLEFGD